METELETAVETFIGTAAFEITESEEPPQIVTADEKAMHRCAIFSNNQKLMNLGEIYIKKKAFELADTAISEGYTTLCCRLEYGADIAAAERYIERQRTNPDIKIACILPYNGWRDDSNEAYLNFCNQTVIPNSGWKHALHRENTHGSAMERDHYVIDRCCKLIFLMDFDKDDGRDQECFDYAVQNSKISHRISIVNIREKQP